MSKKKGGKKEGKEKEKGKKASELSAAMNKLLAGEGGRSAVIEEMADVTIMLEQMQYLMHIDKSEIISTMEGKLNRQLARIKK